MTNEVMVILDLSDDVQTLLEEQDVNLYEELQREEPSLRLELRPDPEAPAGSRDVILVILATATLVSRLTALLLRILYQFTPPNRSGRYEVEEEETRHPDGTVVIHRKRVRVSDEQRPWTALPYPPSQSPAQSGQTSLPQHTDTNQQPSARNAMPISSGPMVPRACNSSMPKKMLYG